MNTSSSIPSNATALAPTINDWLPPSMRPAFDAIGFGFGARRQVHIEAFGRHYVSDGNACFLVPTGDEDFVRGREHLSGDSVFASRCEPFELERGAAGELSPYYSEGITIDVTRFEGCPATGAGRIALFVRSEYVWSADRLFDDVPPKVGERRTGDVRWEARRSHGYAAVLRNGRGLVLAALMETLVRRGEW